MNETMAAAAKEVKFSMRVLINKETNKVLFAEVDSHFADTLISFLALPLGTIVRLLAKHYGDVAPVIGSLNTLYKGLENLDASNFWTEAGKLMLLNPVHPYIDYLKNLKMNIDDTKLVKFFACTNQFCVAAKVISLNMFYRNVRCHCGSLMDQEVSLSLSPTYPHEVGRGVFTVETASFIVSDDLRLMPNSVGFGYDILNRLGFDGAHEVEEKVVVIGFKEVMDLLKGSLISKTPLTDLICRETQKPPLNVNPEFCSVIGKNATTPNSKKATVKAIVQKSTGKILLVQTSEAFVDLLFSIIVIPLGKVLSLLGSDSSSGSMHNIFSSLKCLHSYRYLKYWSPFITPYLPIKYVNNDRQFWVDQKTSLNYYCNKITGSYLSYSKPSADNTSETICIVLLKDPEGHESCIKGPAMYSVTDDLVVKPMSAISVFCALKSLKIPMYDIEEQDIDIGIEEALNILNAALVSKSALNNGLKHLVRKQPKEEK